MPTIRSQTGVSPTRNVSGNSFFTHTFPEGTSQTFKKGEPVYLSGGYVVECGDDPAVILGFAAADASNTTAGAVEVPVWIADFDTIFTASVYHGTPASAVTAQTQVGTAYGIYRDTTNSKCYVDISDVTNTRVVVIDYDHRDDVGDRYGRLLFKVVPAWHQFSRTS